MHSDMPGGEPASVVRLARPPRGAEITSPKMAASSRLWMDVFEQLIVRYGRRLGGKVIVGPTNPVGPDGADGYRKVVGGQDWPDPGRPGPGRRSGWSRPSARCPLPRCPRPHREPERETLLLTARALARYRVFAPEISGLNR
jgi:hypothetical protein